MSLIAIRKFSLKLKNVASKAELSYFNISQMAPSCEKLLPGFV